MTFEKAIPIIDKMLEKHQYKWSLKAITWMDFEDVSQIIRIHIYKKWDQYNENKSLEPWLNTVIKNQIKNIRRNIYDTNSRPCLRCAAAEGEDLCSIYEKQCSNCPIYAHWEKTKKYAHDVKLPVSMENHQQEIYDMPHNDFDLEKSVDNFHIKMKEILKTIEFKVYNYLYIQGLSEEETAKKMGWMTNENNRKPGYNNFVRIKKSIFEKANKIKSEIDLI